MPGAREKSAEEIVLAFRKGGKEMRSQTRVWEGGLVAADRIFGGGRQRSGARSGPAPEPRRMMGELAGDVLGEALEREWFADDADSQAERARRIEELAAAGLALARALAAMKGRGTETGASQQVDVGAALALPHALAGVVAALARIGCAGRADLRASVPARRCRPQRPGAARPQARILDAQRAARHQRLDDQRDSARARRHCRAL